MRKFSVFVHGSAIIALCLSAATASATQQTPVALGSNSNFAIMAATSVTVTGGGTITGNIGIFPGTAFVPGQPAVTVNGNIYAGGPVAAQAQADLTTAVNDAAGRQTPAIVAGNIGGTTLTPGLYKSTSSLAISSGDLTLDAQGNASAVFIFQIASTLTLTSGRRVILAGNANPANIFWQVGSSATIGTTAVIHGNILAAISISVLTGGTVDGRVLAQTGAVSIDTGGGTSITVPVASTRPTVTSTSPVNGATGVPVGNKILATFSVPMNPATISANTFTLQQGTTPVLGSVSYAGITATFSPNSPLAPLSLYTATITTGAQDPSGNALAAPYVLTFSTGASVDTTPPTVTSTAPATSDSQVPFGSAITATFSKALDPSTVTAASFSLKQGSASVAGVVTYSGITAVFTPSSALTALTPYTATISTGVRDLAGNAMASPYIWTFTTGSVAGNAPPTVSSTVPFNQAIGISVLTKLSATFSEAMNPLTITTGTFTLQTGGTPIAGSVSYIGTTATFNPLVPLQFNTVYTATITTGAQDLSGNALAVPYVWTFTTQTANQPPPNASPTVISSVPASGASAVPINNKLSATFSQPMDPTQITTATFTLQRGGISVPGAVAYAGTSATFTPLSPLATSTSYTATIAAGLPDLTGNVTLSPYVWSFTTGSSSNVQSPTLISTIPLNSATGVALNAAISGVFSEPMDPLTINTGTVTIQQGLGTISSSVSYSGTTFILKPTLALQPNTVYTATVSAGAKDLAGNALNAGSNSAWTFTTGPTALPIPVIFPNGTVNSFAGTVNDASYTFPVAPGSIAAVFGANLAIGQSGAQIPTPLPTTLAQSSVNIGGRAAPLYFASPGQLNVQIPWEMAGQTQTPIVATVANVSSVAQIVNLAPFAPGIFTIDSSGSGQGAILVAPSAQLASAGSPVARGGYISIFATGLGAVTNQPATGAPSPSLPLAVTLTLPTVTIGGVPSLVTYSGLAPTLVGLYQVNVLVPAAVAPGNAVPVSITIGGAVSNTVTIAVQ